MQQFEFHVYQGDCDGNVATHPEVSYAPGTESAAKSKAGRLAKKHGGPVDLAYAGGAEFSDRYITTASPSDVHASGHRFERLS